MNRFATLAAPLFLCAALMSCAVEKRDAQQARAAETPAVEPPATQPPAETEIPIDEMPQLLTSPVSYPEEARNNREEGTVLVKARIGKDGHVMEAQAEPDSNASPLLEKAALEAVRSWTFSPGKAKGEPVETWVVLPVRYKLK